MCAMSDPKNSRRIIQIGGPNAPRGNPVYSVPLQTTATINISLGGVGRTNAAGIGSGTKIRLNSRGAEMSNSSPRGILKGSGNQGSQAGIYGEGQRRSAAGTLATGEIVPQIAPIVQSSRSRYDAQVENAQLLHAADVHSVHSMSDQLDKASLSSTPYLMAADRRSTGSMGIQTEGQGNLSDTYNVIGSSTGTQVAPSDLGSLRKAPSESPYSHSNQSNTYGTSSEVGARSVGAGSGIYGGSNTGAGSGIYGSGSNTYATADEAAMVYSGIGSQNGDAVAEPVYSSGSTKSGGGASENQVYAAQAAVVKSKRDSTATSKEGVYGTAGGGGGDEKIYGDDEGSWMDKEADPNSFRFIGWEVDSDQDENLPCKRVLVMKEPDMVLMFTASCQTEAAGNNKKLLDLMVDIADSCVNRLRVLITDVTSANIAASNMDSLPLSDGRHTKDHLEELSKELGETVAITDVAFRIQPPDGVYLGTFVQGTVVAKRNYAIGKVGVVAVLTKKSKFATVEAFSEQLCEHIARTKPANLGTMRGANTKHMTRRGMGKLQQQQRDQLLLQNFIFDQTIVVAEAARRSFCKIDGFLLFK